MSQDEQGIVKVEAQMDQKDRHDKGTAKLESVVEFPPEG